MRDHFLNLIAVVGGINLGDCFSAISVGLGSQWYLIFVARVEGDLEDFLVAAADGHRLAGGQFDPLEQRRLRGVSRHLALSFHASRFQFKLKKKKKTIDGTR